jgi:hypothetical protein
MKDILKKITTMTIAFGMTILLAACGGGCGVDHRDGHPQHRHAPKLVAPQNEVIMYEAEAVEVVEMQPVAMMKAKMYTRSSNGGTSEMGYIKFAPASDGVNMMVDVTDLRPGKDYVMKIYPCGNCNDYSCCAEKCLDVKLPVLSIDEPGRLTKTFNITGISCADLSNAKIILTRDGGYKAAWGKIKSKSR